MVERREKVQSRANLNGGELDWEFLSKEGGSKPGPT